MFRALAHLFGGGSSQQLSRVELFFLSKFEKPTNPSKVNAYLEATLQQSPTKIAKKFLAAGIIESAPEITSLLASAKQADLKEALRSAGLKVSGKKEELAQRLFENRPNVARAMVDRPRFILTDGGREQVDKFQTAESQADERHTIEWFRCFDNRDLKGLVAAHRAYSDWEIKPPASFNPMGISLPDDRMIEMYQAIIEASPGILGQTSTTTLRYLRHCAAWDFASGGRGGSNRFPVPSDYKCGQGPAVAARMIFFAAKHNIDMRSYKRLGILKCEILGSGDSCGHCQKFVGKAFSVGRVPELPHAKCTNEMGCRCTVIMGSI